MTAPEEIPFHRKLAAGEGTPLVILHGLLGSSRNWISFGRILEGHRTVYAMDLRNHGESFHPPAMTYPDLAGDLRRFLDFHGLEQVHLLGHSLGGKVAMFSTLMHPEPVRSLIIADIAPVDYEPHYLRAIQTMAAIDLRQANRRKDIEARLEKIAPDWAFRQFLLTNLERNDGGFHWKANLPALIGHHHHLAANPLPPDRHHHGPALLLSGEKSAFVQPRGKTAFVHHFPEGQHVSLLAGHNLHIEAAALFASEVLHFLQEVEKSR